MILNRLTLGALESVALWVLTLLVPLAVEAASFFDRQAIMERRQWSLFNPEDLIEAILTADAPVETTYRLEVNIPARRLVLFRGENQVKTYPVAVGSIEHRTPVGPRALQAISWNPWWYPPDEEWAKDAVVTPPGPSNPLGRVKMPLGGDIVLHGTNAEGTVGQPVSHGCMRMRNKDIEELAWFFQAQFSDETDDLLLQRYRRSRGQTHNVKLNRSIPVTINYDRIAVYDEEVVIYPDVYRRTRDLAYQILKKLEGIGIPSSEVDPMKLSEIEDGTNRTPVPILDLLILSPRSGL